LKIFVRRSFLFFYHKLHKLDVSVINQQIALFLASSSLITTFSLCSTMLYIRTPDYSSNWNSYLAPFKWQLWGAIVASTFLLAVGLHIVCNFGIVQENKHSQRHSLLEAFHCVFACLCWQGKKMMHL
jgi:hypothetical protein